jgi:DNA-binding Lrp family transcriptional regulator
MLEPVDILLCLKLNLYDDQIKPSFEELAEATTIGSSTLHRAAKRAQDAGLLKQDKSVLRKPLLEFLLHGIKYAFYVKPGSETRGMPTAYAASPLKSVIALPSRIPVWPDSKGEVRGFTVTPLHKQAPEAARRDPNLYELLALVDAIRIGSAREYQLAKDELEKRLK